MASNSASSNTASSRPECARRLRLRMHMAAARLRRHAAINLGCGRRLTVSGTGRTVNIPHKEAAMPEHFVWMTTRRIKPGTLTDFERAWRPERKPEGMRRAYAYWSADEQEVVGVSFWDSKESCDAWRASEAEAHRRQAMAP